MRWLKFTAGSNTSWGIVEGDKIARAGIALAGILQDAVADAEDALHALEIFRRQRLVERF